MNAVMIVISAVFINNLVLMRLFADGSTLENAKKTESAARTGTAVFVVMTLAVALMYAVNKWILAPLNAEFLNLIALILVVAGIVQVLKAVLKRLFPKLYGIFCPYLQLAAVNTAIMGMALLSLTDALVTGFLSAVLSGIAYGAGFLAAVFLLAGLLEKTERSSSIPKPLRGLPITLLTACLMAMAFYVFGTIQF